MTSSHSCGNRLLPTVDYAPSGGWQTPTVDIAPSPKAFDSCPRCGVTIPDKTESDDEYEFCYKCDLELSELAGGWASWNKNSPSPSGR